MISTAIAILFAGYFISGGLYEIARAIKNK